MLQGRVAGMVVTNSSSRVGTAPKIQIRGTSTLQGNRDPLWVVDGIIQEDFQVTLDNGELMTKNLKDIIGNQISNRCQRHRIDQHLERCFRHCYLWFESI